MLTQNAFQNLLPPEECNIFYTNCKLKNNQNYKFKKKSLFWEFIFNICFFLCFSERFLYKDSGERYSYLPFGIGHRVCLGSNIAKMSVFSFCATLIKNYKITVPDGSPLPDMKPNAGLTNRPKPFEIKLVKRCWFWYGICRWFFSGERLKDFIQWRLLLILTIQRWFEKYFPPQKSKWTCILVDSPLLDLRRAAFIFIYSMYVHVEKLITYVDIYCVPLSMSFIY